MSVITVSVFLIMWTTITGYPIDISELDYKTVIYLQALGHYAITPSKWKFVIYRDMEGYIAKYE